ncbi:hypothetical protein IMCC3317_22200 [Kordia antarctica]|uniref:Uncharacterized protein n=1 Tax=Kordia antarctica TaxID=1218801 RepID=A0A7L4ZJZ2_9FLAO|nr:hypothetical protein [Kordia antarctica]QHI36850.1 hypothetical protein IMCC3317_22200 [Kordia antarctica]
MKHKTISFREQANKVIERRTSNSTGKISDACMQVTMPKSADLDYINPLRVKMTLKGLSEMSDIDKMGVVVGKVRTHSKSLNNRRKMVRIIRSGNTVSERIIFANNVYRK